MRGFFICKMKGRYFLASFFGALVGAACVLVVVYVTNTRALAIDVPETDASINALHTRINDFYIFAGIVITLLLAINVGVFIRAEDEVEKHINANFDSYRVKIRDIYNQCAHVLRKIKNLKDYEN